MTRKTATMPSQGRVRELLDYNADTGMFCWRLSVGSRARIGAHAGSVAKNGYRSIRVDGTLYYAHRLAFVWMNGDCPNQIDHKDRNRSNNAWNNLRAANHSQNQANQKISRKNTSGAKGVSWLKVDKKWRAYITVNGVKKHLGRFDNRSEAIAAYAEAASEKFGCFAAPLQQCSNRINHYK